MALKKKLKHKAGHHSSLVAQPKRLATKPHHARSYRKRHFSVLTLAMILLVFLLLQVGVIVGANRPQPLPQSLTSSHSPANLTLVRSSYGFSFDFDGNTFAATANEVDSNNSNQAVNQDELVAGKNLSLVTLKPRPGMIESRLISNQLTMQVMPTGQELTALKQKPANATLTEGDLAAQVFPITSSADFEVKLLSSGSDTLGGGKIVTKKVYQFTPKFSGGLSYAVVWTGVIKDRPFALKINGLVGSSTIPDVFMPVLDSLQLDADQKVQGVSTLFGRKASTSTPYLDSKFVADSASPAVVKIYHIVCGKLIIFGSDFGDSCDGGTGSGFFVSSDGYIATNGHVAVISAKDYAVKIISGDNGLLNSYLRDVLALSNTQITAAAKDPQMLGSLIAKIYDTSDKEIRFDNLQDTLLVALGDDPLEIKSRIGLKTLASKSDTDTIKKAQFVGADYSGKDLINVGAGNPAGFSSSDVALLKIDIKNAPLIRINRVPIIQNQKITVLGFPGDAENQLVNNKSLGTSVTNGVVSSIRQAAGGKTRLYQSDVDASHGNSGGPALTEDGTAFGLLTYRIPGDDEGNSPKSYVRDIADFQQLAAINKVGFNTNSTTQAAWDKGLDLYSKNHYSAAIHEFNKVKEIYPAHRLVSVYIDNANKQITAGKDVKEFPVVLLGVSLAVVVAIITGTVVLIISHARHHRSYVLQNAYAPADQPLSVQH
jgi:hypothetical protein